VGTSIYTSPELENDGKYDEKVSNVHKALDGCRCEASPRTLASLPPLFPSDFQQELITQRMCFRAETSIQGIFWMHPPPFMLLHISSRWAVGIAFSKSA